MKPWTPAGTTATVVGLFRSDQDTRGNVFQRCHAAEFDFIRQLFCTNNISQSSRSMAAFIWSPHCTDHETMTLTVGHGGTKLLLILRLLLDAVAAFSCYCHWRDGLVVSVLDQQPRGRGFESAGCGLSCSNRGPVALCTLGLGLLNPPSSRGR